MVSTSDLSAAIAENLASVRRRIDAAARTAGRDPAGVRLIAVSKTFAAAAVRAAAEARQVDFGENKVQEALDKMRETASLDLRWHLIGHLQSNKARKAAASFACIHSIDSRDLLERVDRAAAEQGKSPDLLIQVDLALEATKHGARVEEVPALLAAAAGMRGAVLAGLMLLPPAVDDPEDARPWFRRLRELRDGWVQDGTPADRLHQLSMGMSHDFEVAIAEGATMVRVGSAIFGSRY